MSWLPDARSSSSTATSVFLTRLQECRFRSRSRGAVVQLHPVAVSICHHKRPGDVDCHAGVVVAASLHSARRWSTWSFSVNIEVAHLPSARVNRPTAGNAVDLSAAHRVVGHRNALRLQSRQDPLEGHTCKLSPIPARPGRCSPATGLRRRVGCGDLLYGLALNFQQIDCSSSRWSDRPQRPSGSGSSRCLSDRHRQTIDLMRHIGALASPDLRRHP